MYAYIFHTWNTYILFDFPLSLRDNASREIAWRDLDPRAQQASTKRLCRPMHRPISPRSSHPPCSHPHLWKLKRRRRVSPHARSESFDCAFARPNSVRENRAKNREYPSRRPEVRSWLALGCRIPRDRLLRGRSRGSASPQFGWPAFRVARSREFPSRYCYTCKSRVTSYPLNSPWISRTVFSLSLSVCLVRCECPSFSFPQLDEVNGAPSTESRTKNLTTRHLRYVLAR